MTESARHFILATAGHVDHGKSTLVRALTGTDPDRLPEEKARGITIDLGFAHLQLKSPQGIESQRTYNLGIVDVPGHEDFVKNMVSGVGAVDLALLVVAADDEWMPQTEEHLQILLYLGVTHLVVALTKVDLVADVQRASDSVRTRLVETPFANAEIVPTSATTSRGIDDLRSAIRECLSRLSPPPDIDKPRLAVDRAFTLPGVGTVVTGTLTEGTLRRDQQVIMQPAGTVSRVRSLQTAQREMAHAGPGSRVAINLPDVGCGKRAGGVARGDVITRADIGVVTSAVDVVLYRSPRARRSDRSPEAGARLTDGVEVKLHHGPQTTMARVRLLDANELQPGDRRLARLALDTQMLLMIGDRAVIRSASEMETLCGATVLDVAPPNGKSFRLRHGSAQVVAMAGRAAGPNNVEISIATQIERDGSAMRQDLFRVLKCSSEVFDQTVASLAARGVIVERGPDLVNASGWKRLHEQAAELVDRHHREHPEQQGLPIERLRIDLSRGARACGFRTAGTALMDSIIENLCGEGFVRAGAAISRSTHRIALPSRLRAAGEQCRRELAKRPLDPPSRKELCKTDATFQALRFLLASGEVVEVGPDVVLSAEAFARATQAVRSHLEARETATVSELKSLLGSSRRVVVPLLERLDRDGVTRRQGDVRTLKT